MYGLTSMGALTNSRSYTWGNRLHKEVATRSRAFLEKSEKLLCSPPPDAYSFIKAFVAGMVFKKEPRE